MFFPYTFMVLSVFIGVFQIALALGAPLGDFTMGGKFPGKLPPGMRIAALVQIGILGFFCALVLSRAGIAFESMSGIAGVGMWFVLAFFVFGTIVNISSPSKKERYLMGPLNIVALVSVFMTAIL